MRTLRILSSLVCLLHIFHLVYSKCVTSSCGGNKTLPIHYPFGLQGGGKHQKGCDYPSIDLTCSSSTQTSAPVLNLPSFGDLYVRDINYTTQTVQLYDPNDCLAGLFVNSYFPNINSSVTALNYQNYTFFTCPTSGFASSGANFTAIACLSNSSVSVLATTSILRAQELSRLGCNMSSTVPVPVSSSLQFEYNGFVGDLLLTWNVPYCDVCEKKSGVSAGKVVGLVILSLVWPYASVLAMYILIMALIKIIKWLYYIIRWLINGTKSIFSRLRRLFSPRTQSSSVQLHEINREGAIRLPRNVAPAASSNNNNNNNNNISSVTRTIVVGESRRISGPNGTVCPICLEEFKAKETLRCISQCGHSFHTDCIDQWLRSHRTCPVCRNTP